LQFLDEENSTSLIFAATNHPEILDKAFFRRFDTSIPFHLPSAELVRPLVEETLVEFNLDAIDWSTIRQAAAGLSQADIVRASDDAARIAVLDQDGVLTTAQLVESLRDGLTSAR
jgi:AAA+ superfamily predicted ATPase